MRISDWSSDVCSSDLPTDRSLLKRMSPPCSLGTYQECEARNERTEHESSRSGDGGKFPVQPRRQDSIGDTFELEIIGDFRGEFVARQQDRKSTRLNSSH